LLRLGFNYNDVINVGHSYGDLYYLLAFHEKFTLKQSSFGLNLWFVGVIVKIFEPHFEIGHYFEQLVRIFK